MQAEWTKRIKKRDCGAGGKGENAAFHRKLIETKC